MVKNILNTAQLIEWLFIGFFYLSVSFSFGQTINVSQVANPIATSPLNAGSTGQVILNFSLTRQGGTATAFTALTINTSTDPNLVFSNVALWTGVEGSQVNVSSTVTLNNSSIVFTQLNNNPLWNFAQGGQNSGPIYFSIIVDVKPTVPTTVANSPQIQLSLTQAGITMSNGTVSAFSFASAYYNFKGCTTPLLSISTTNNSNCVGPNGTVSITASTSGGEPAAGYSYQWYQGTDTSNPIGGATLNTLSNLASGSYTVKVLNNDFGSCTSLATVTINEALSLPIIDATAVTIIKETSPGASDGSINASGDVTGGSGSFTYKWYTSQLNPIGTNSPLLTNLLAGDYLLEVVDGIKGCSSGQQTFRINSDTGCTPPSLIVNNVTTCSTQIGGNVAAIDLTQYAIVDNGTITYSVNGFTISNPQNYQATNGEVITVIGTSGPSCQSTATLTVTVNSRQLSGICSQGLIFDLIGSELTALYQIFQSGNVVYSNEVFFINSDRVLIEIIFYDGKLNELINLVSSLGFEFDPSITDNENDRIISGWFPIPNLLALNQFTSWINYVRPAYPPIINGGLVTSEGDRAIATDKARNQFGVTGEGIKVGVLSDSYNTLPFDPASRDIFNGDLPGPSNPINNFNPVYLLKDYPSHFGMGSDEGRALLQIIHDIAPKADLAFRTGAITPTDFAKGIEELQWLGCNVIMDDITFITEPFFRDGVVAQAVDYVASQGVTYVTSAGNFGDQSYESTFTPTTAPNGITGSVHDFGNGDVRQQITLGQGVYTVVLQWDDPFYSLGGTGAQNDLDIYFTDFNGNPLFGFNRNNLGGDPIEVLSASVPGETIVNMMVVRAAGTQNVRFKYIVFRGTFIVNEYQSNSSTIVGQANATGAITVGATLYSDSPAFGVSPPLVESFSSQGGTIVNGFVRGKPDLTAPDGVNTTVNGPRDFENDGFANLIGTSAAAAHAAGSAALLLEAYRVSNLTTTPEKIRNDLKSTALDIGPPGFDFTSGAGFIQPLAAISTVAPSFNFPVARTDFGNALDFDGINDFILLPGDNLNEIKSGYTIEVWAKQRIGNKNLLSINTINGGSINLTTDGFNKDGNYYLINSQVLENEWHHYAVTVDTYGKGLFYVDGVATSSKEAGLPIELSASLVKIGANVTNDELFDGVLDEFRIWNFPKTKIELYQHIYIPVTGKEPGLIYYSDFNEGEPNGDNAGVTNFVDVVTGKEGELLGFNLNGSSSNWVRSDLNDGNPDVPIVMRISPASAIPGTEVILHGSNLVNDPRSYKVTFGTVEVSIISIENSTIKVIVPNDITGLNKVRVINIFGSSAPVDFTIISGFSQLPFSWNKQTIYSQITPYEVEEADINGDGFLDIVIAGKRELVLLPNDKLGKFPALTLVSSSSTITYSNLSLVDLDQDGDTDIVCTEDRTSLVWFQNNSSGSWVRIPVLEGQPAMEIEPIDADRDGDMDVIIFGELPELSNNKGIKIIENNGTGGLNNIINIKRTDIIGYNPGVPLFPLYQTTLVPALIDLYDLDFTNSNVNAGGVQYSPKRLMVSDHNKDGFFDIIILTSGDPGAIYNFIFDVTSASFERDYVGPTSSYGDVISSADLNNDGQEDIADIGYACCFGYRLSEGLDYLGNLFWSDRVEGGPVTSKGSFLDPADLNGDGYVDFLTAYNSTVVDANWLKNEGGTGGFTANSISFTKGTHDALNVVDGRAVDLDNDGDLDVVTASTQDNRVIAFFHVFSDKDFKTFQLAEQSVGTTATIDSQAHTVDVTVNNTANLTKLIPEFTLSLKATASVGTAPQISNVTLADFNNTGKSLVYKITAEDGSKQNWTVRIHPLPGVPVLNSITAITPTGAKVNLTNGSFTDTNEFEVSTDNFATVINGTTATLNGLTAGTTYLVRAKGKNAYGLSADYSNVLPFITIPSTPVLNAIANITQTTAIASWPSVTGADTYKVEVSAGGVAFSPYNPIEVTNGNLSITGLTGGVEYKVRVSAVNASGASAYSTLVTFVTIPANPIAAAATVVTANTFVANWNVVAGAASYTVDLSADNFATVSETKTVASGNSVTFSNLNAGNSYSYLVRAINSTGLASGNSNAVSLSTLPVAPSLDPVTTITPTSATLNWQSVNGATLYQVDLSKDNFSTFVQPYNNFNVGANNVQLNDLSPGTAYQFRVRASNASGSAPNFSGSGFITVPSIPLTKAPSSITTTSFMANWDAVANPGVSGYDVELSADNFTSVLKSEYVITGTSKEFTGLTPGTGYSYRVRSRNANNLSSSNSLTINATTLPLQPEVQSIAGISQKGATISWLPVAGAAIYRVDVSRDNFNTFVANGQESGATTLVLSDLTAGTTYSVRVRAVNAGGASANSDTRVFTTIPPEPMAKEATLKTSVSFVANWDASPTATSYSIEISNNNFSTVLATTTTSETFTSFKNVALGKTYSYKVKATNASGTSGYSNAIQVVPTYSVTITSQFFDENTKTASITAISSAGIDSVRLFYRGIASGEYKSVNVPLPSGTTYEIAITTEMQDEMGTEYYFNVKDKLGDQRRGDLSYYYKRIETAERVQIPITRFGRGASNYTLFSIPYQLDDQDMQSVFEPVLGSYDDTQWKLVRYQDGRNVDYGAGLNKLEPGKGYWFASLNQVQPQVGSGTVVRANRALSYSLFLQKGWNQVGDPLPFDVSWTDVLGNNKDVKGVGRLYVFEGGAFKKGDLKTWGGGFVKSERDVELKIPVTVKRTSSGRNSDTDITNTDISQSAWITPLTIEHGGAVNDLGAIGMHERASFTSDEFDEQSLPRFINYLELNSYHPEYFMPRFMRDIVTTIPSFNWSYAVESNYEDEQATLRWDANAMGQNEAQLILYDVEGRQLVDMKRSSSYPFKFSGKRNLKFFYSIDKEHFSPDLDGVGQAYPNPFESNTSIPFIVHKDDTGVVCTVHNLMGRTLKTLLAHQLKAGYHQTYWDGADSQGIKVPTGMYIYRFSFNNALMQTGKVILK